MGIRLLIYFFNTHMYSIYMINTYNESNLHKTLKNMYAEAYHGETEVEKNGYFCDILTKDQCVIEIQTGNLGKLLPKLLSLKDNFKIKVIYPQPTIRIIKTYNTDEELISKRKSPKKLNWYSLFDELMGIYPILSEDWFTLEVLQTSVIEKRIKGDELIQLPNKSRRFRKNWYKTGKELDSIIDKKIFSNKYDYKKLLPELPNEKFCAKDLALAGTGKQAHKILWVLNKIEVIKEIEKKGNTKYYSFII